MSQCPRTTIVMLVARRKSAYRSRETAVWAARRSSSGSIRPAGVRASGACGAGGLLGDGGNQLARERGDVLDDPAPHDVSVPERGLIDPRGSGVDQVILDAATARGSVTGDDPCRDPDQPRVADQADDLPLLVRRANEAGDLLESAKLVRSPAAGNHDRLEVVAGDLLRCDVAGGFQTVLPVVLPG